MNYFYSLTDKQGYIHSIDMLYIEWTYICHFDKLIDCIREIKERNLQLRYEEYLNRKKCSKYNFYRDSLIIGTCYLNMGKYRQFDKESKKEYVFPMCELRFNPNKVANEEYFKDLIQILIRFSGKGTGYIKKYDYTIDIPLSPEYIKVFGTRKERGLYKGTRYFGQSGRHNYLKIYDKAKELNEKEEDIKNLTRIEYTFKGLEIPSFEKIYVLNHELCNDYSNLKDTDIAIIEMYSMLQQFGYEYELKLGRVKMEKLSKYLFGAYELLDYGAYREQLLKYYEELYELSSDIDTSFLPDFENDLSFD